MKTKVMVLEMNLELLRKDDPMAVSELVKDRRFYFFSKRVFDLVFASLALICLSPLMLIIAIVVVLDSPGPAIFVQKRVGGKRVAGDGYSYWQKNEFDFYKFRTMHQNSDPGLHKEYFRAFVNNDVKKMAELQKGKFNVHKLVVDPRLTRVGAIIRKFSLDEFPQFWNVVKGDMSLVGPRPAIPYEVDMYKPWHTRRLEGQPGITGIWQVSSRSMVDFDDMVRMDIEYLQTQTFMMDLKIVLKTPFAVISRKGAH